MAEPTIDDLLKYHTPAVRELALRACELVRGVLPGAHEKVHLGWKVVAFGTGGRMSDMVFGVAPLGERVNLQLSGADLPDPAGLLEGTGKAVRHVKVTGPEVLENPALVDLLRAAVEAHATPRTEREARAGAPPEGFRAYAGKTVGAPLDALFAAWTDEATRSRWLHEPGVEVRGATPGRSLRARWSDGSPFDVRFEARGEGKSQVSVDHQKLASPEDAARVKGGWQESLSRLKALLEG
jgi:hypothetical protein